MPEVHFQVSWPDGHVQRCTSPSRAIEAHLAPAATYPVAEFVRRVDAGMDAASERVRQQYGMACTSAMAQKESVAQAAAEHAPDGGGTVHVHYLRRGAAGRSASQRTFRGAQAAKLSGHVPVVIVGGGQAGLSMSWSLKEQGVGHVVLERHTVAHSWKEDRWESFCLVTPNWQCTLPGHPYAGDDPTGFMVQDEIVEYVESYAAAFDAPVHEGVAVTSVEARGVGSDPAANRPAGAARDSSTAPSAADVVDGVLAAAPEGYVVRTTAGDLTCDAVVLAVGGYHVPTVPRMAERLPATVTQIHSSRYKSASPLPDGAVLVVGSGQSGAQIAEDLHLAGREVHLAVGTAPRVARTYRGRDVVAWLHDSGHYDMAIEDHKEGLGARHEANHYVTGRDGGRDIDLRRFAAEGMTLHGRLAALDVDGTATFAGDLKRNLDMADAVSERIKDGIDAWIAAHGVDAPEEDRYVPVWEPEDDGGALVDLHAAGITTVIWSTGFRSDWSWVKVPAFDGSGYPTHHRGVTSVPGLFVLGLPWQHTWGSGRFAGVARDAGHLAPRVAAVTAAATTAG
ncbi:MAG: MSMEG_0569 family flavin-dependent oxidoreductase [Patulibacter sp.]|nr:MSMEG_0569 family flavin-dependent oxidoreductase [Patulibacter sp.]MDO9409333.1 MSMEG_0569 family flavin-dependent oxidoreductase [Patulibacter sp.]